MIETTLQRKTEYANQTLSFYVYDGPRVIQFKLLLGFGVPESSQDLFPMASDLGYHSPVQMYDGQQEILTECEWTGGKCYYDGTSLGAEKPFQILQKKGDEALWKFLEEYWHRVFEAGEVLGFGYLLNELCDSMKAEQ